MVSLPVLISTHPTPFVEEEALPLIAAECLMFPLFFAPFAYFLAGWFKRLESIMKFVPLAMLIGCSLPAMGIFALVQAGGERAVFWSEVAHVALSLLNPLYGLPWVRAGVSSARALHATLADHRSGTRAVRHFSKYRPICPNPGRVRPKSPNSSTAVEGGRSRARSGRIWPTWGRTGQDWADFDRFGADFGQLWPGIDHIRPNLPAFAQACKSRQKLVQF